MREVHLVNGHEIYVYWIDTVYVQNNLPTEFSKRTIFIIWGNGCNFGIKMNVEMFPKRTSDTLIGHLLIFQVLPKASLCTRYHWYPFE